MNRRTLRLNHVRRVIALIERLPPDEFAQLLEVLRRHAGGQPLGAALESVTGDTAPPRAWTDEA